jgi:hypothetical protein
MQAVDPFNGGPRITMKDLKERVIRGGFAKMCAQGANYTLRIGSLMVLARLRTSTFGLVHRQYCFISGIES